MYTQVDEDIVQLIEEKVVNIERYELEEIKNGLCSSKEKIEGFDKMLMEKDDLIVTLKEGLKDCKETLRMRYGICTLIGSTTLPSLKWNRLCVAEL